MNGPGYTIAKLLESVKREKPAAFTVGSHQYVQMAEMDFSTTGLQGQDLSSVFSIMPVGTSVPEGLFEKLQMKFPNLAVTYLIDFNFENLSFYILYKKITKSCHFKSAVTSNFQIRLNAYGATEAGPISVGFFGGENMGILACRVKVKVVFNIRV